MMTTEPTVTELPLDVQKKLSLWDKFKQFCGFSGEGKLQIFINQRNLAAIICSSYVVKSQSPWEKATMFVEWSMDENGKFLGAFIEMQKDGVVSGEKK